jgi:hypothetical protein
VGLRMRMHVCLLYCLTWPIPKGPRANSLCIVVRSPMPTRHWRSMRWPGSEGTCPGTRSLRPKCYHRLQSDRRRSLRPIQPRCNWPCGAGRPPRPPRLPRATCLCRPPPSSRNGKSRLSHWRKWTVKVPTDQSIGMHALLYLRVPVLHTHILSLCLFIYCHCLCLCLSLSLSVSLALMADKGRWGLAGTVISMEWRWRRL